MKKIILPLCCGLLLVGLSCEKENAQPEVNADLETLARIEAQVQPILVEMQTEQHSLLYLDENDEVKGYERYRIEELESMEESSSSQSGQHCGSNSSSSENQVRPFMSDNPRLVRQRVARHLNAGHCVLVQRIRGGWTVERVRCLER